jgi:hypothetical protein
MDDLYLSAPEKAGKGKKGANKKAGKGGVQSMRVSGEGADLASNSPIRTPPEGSDEEI